MKKVLLSAVALFVFGVASAQVKFGVKGGVNFATFTGAGADLIDAKMKVGFNVGGFAEIKFNDKFALQPELLYSLQGAKGVSTDSNGLLNSSEDVKQNLSYLNVPVMVKFYPIKSLYVEAGPQVGFLVSAKEKTDGTEIDFNEVSGNEELVNVSTNEDVKDFYKSIDFDFNIGAGYEFTENLFAGVRYSIGLTDVSDVPTTISFFGVSGFEMKNNVLSLSLGYKF